MKPITLWNMRNFNNEAPPGLYHFRLMCRCYACFGAGVFSWICRESAVLRSSRLVYSIWCGSALAPQRIAFCRGEFESTLPSVTGIVFMFRYNLTWLLSRMAFQPAIDLSHILAPMVLFHLDHGKNHWCGDGGCVMTKMLMIVPMNFYYLFKSTYFCCVVSDCIIAVLVMLVFERKHFIVPHKNQMIQQNVKKKHVSETKGSPKKLMRPFGVGPLVTK